MKSLLAEYLRNILVEQQPEPIVPKEGEPPEIKGLYRGKFGKIYSDPQLTQYAGRIEGGRFIPASVEPEKKERQTKADEPQEPVDQAAIKAQQAQVKVDNISMRLDDPNIDETLFEYAEGEDVKEMLRLMGELKALSIDVDLTDEQRRNADQLLAGFIKVFEHYNKFKTDKNPAEQEESLANIKVVLDALQDKYKFSPDMETDMFGEDNRGVLGGSDSPLVKQLRGVFEDAGISLADGGSVERAALEINPDAQKITVIDDIDHDELTDIMSDQDVETGETDLPADMEPMVDDYVDVSLTGHYSDDEYYKRMGKKFKIRSPLYKMSDQLRDALRKNGFPDQYIQLVERSMNVERRGDEPTFSDMMPGVGAGQNQSQFGEIMSMFMISLPSELRDAAAAELNNTIGTPKQQRESGISPIAERSWVTAAIGHAEAFDTYMNESYGNGMWRLEASAWDRRVDIQRIGLSYDNKGFSTDIILRVQPVDSDGNPTGPAQAQRTSLKKDENVMLFNGGVGEIKSLVRGYISPKDRDVYRKLSVIFTRLGSNRPKEERDTALEICRKIFKDPKMSATAARTALQTQIGKIDETARKRAPEHIRNVLDRVTNFTETQTESAVQIMQSVVGGDALPDTRTPEVKSAIENAFSKPADQKFAAKVYDSFQTCKSEGVGRDGIQECMSVKVFGKSKIPNDRLSKMGTYLGRVAAEINPDRHQQQVDEHLDLATNLGNDYMALFSRENPVMLGGLMGVLAEKFPLGVTMSGTEFMVINGVHVGTDTLGTLFGVKNYEELQLGLKIIDVDGQRMLAYQAQGSEDPIVIGLVDARQKGRGYASVGFEIKCSEEFVMKAAEANEQNGHTSSANSGAVERIGKRIAKRTR